MSQSEGKEAGWEHAVDYRDGFHERLGKYWPEDKEQLHSGGWQETFRLIKWLDLDSAPTKPPLHLLDLCCGEGATAVYLAKNCGVRVSGIDIVPAAIAAAKQKAEAAGVSSLANFVVGNAFKLPYDDNTFDHAFGQDPDALSHPQRGLIFKEVLRVLKPGGRFIFHHHWIPGLGFPSHEVQALEKWCKDAGFLAIEDACADSYVRDCKGAGFEIEQVDDIQYMAASHLRGNAINHLKDEKHPGKIADKWLEYVLSFIDRGLPFGVRIHARKRESGLDPESPIAVRHDAHTRHTHLHTHTHSHKLRYIGIGVAVGALVALAVEHLLLKPKNSKL